LASATGDQGTLQRIAGYATYKGGMPGIEDYIKAKQSRQSVSG